MQLTIQQKLIAMGAAVVIALAIILIQSLVTSSQLSNLQSLHADIKELQITMLQLRRNEKDFLMRQDAKYLETFSQNSDNAQRLSARVIEELKTEGESTSRMQGIRADLVEYLSIFQKLVERSKTRGLDKDSGHYGLLRTATHNMEAEIEKLGDLDSHVKVLTLRRHEKDFILRMDEKYVGRHQQVAQQLAQQISGLPAQYLQTYVKEFADFVAIEKEIGLDSKSGIRGEMRATVHKVEEALEQESTQLNAYIEDKYASTATLSTIIMIVISLILVAILAAIAYQVIMPLKSISQEITNIRKSNDLSRRVRESNDEIGTVAKNFNIFMEHFQNLIRNINEAVYSLKLATETVSSSVSKTSDGLLIQSQESDMVATAVTELGASASEIAQNAQSTSDRTEQATNNAKNGNNKLNQTISNVQGLSEQLVEAGTVMQQLEEKSNGITSVLDVIRGIAEQTNLLALNAAIEAARAGEQGRGFAVVADEVRTLAVRTQESTSEITAIIEELQASTSSIAKTVEVCKESGVESANMATEAGTVLNLIVDDMNAIAMMTAEIASAVTEQSTVVQDVDQNIVRIRDVGEQVAADSQENAKASQQVAELAQVLHEEAKVFKV
ncbi:methyl-accepting chemotaxis protein [Alteromonas sediminis]|uniref:Methyl-accepting chemotaxis protein n=1 Tax=Alteromonas sediminis TaxID=2259342 RepID=A0A3N5Z9G0_9ALTE|nr:HAMP domain-containing methyl-accepting chemotaxis protein [Alteromonas sediminis]RPJ65868.1 methyl-accepting chemotaxis protein [Alteromonas sediminis]